MVVLDACFSGKSSSGTALVEGLQPLVPTYAQQTGSATVFSAGRADQFAGPLPGTRRPAFSYLLLGALRGWGDADGHGTVTAQEALDYTTSALYALVRDRAQTPELRGPGGPEVLARAEEDGPDLAAMVLSMEPGRGALPATGESTVSTGSDVDLAAAAAEAQRLRREREALEERERELQRQLAEERQRRRDEATADLLDSARVEWLALAPLIDSPSSEAAGVVELYVEKYGDAGVTVDGEKTTVTVSQVDEAREWLQRHARTLRDGSFGGEVIDRLGYEMISIASGDFWMGSPSTDTGWSEDEIEHHVRITAPYLIGATEVTQDLWKAVMEDSPAANRQSYFSGGTRGACNEMDGVSLVGGDLPVHCVDWLDVVRFCNRLSEAEGLEPAYQISGETVTWDRMTAGYRLPTEAEWEFAARAGSSDRYAGTDNDDRVCEIGNVTGVETSSRWPGWQALSCSDGVAGLASTASFRANRWGLYDMTGNVYEWVWDWYGEYPGGTTTDPVGPPTGPGRIIRGGSWDRGPEDVRVANRSYNLPNGRRTNNGFRVARSIP